MSKNIVTHTMGDELNRTHEAEEQLVPPPVPTETPITMLAVPKVWTRIMIIALIVEAMILGLLSFIVYIAYTTTRDNTNRLMYQQGQIEEIKGRIEQIRQLSDPPPTK